ncbi:hypothetical protein [Streptomyces sp. NPDC051286]|uniref:hypothetical protein n=1 Tax=Streptomyces sp. NPDC051286 TaxID=3365647 RepID=UPI0037A79962
MCGLSGDSRGGGLGTGTGTGTLRPAHFRWYAGADPGSARRIGGRSAAPRGLLAPEPRRPDRHPLLRRILRPFGRTPGHSFGRSLDDSALALRTLPGRIGRQAGHPLLLGPGLGFTPRPTLGPGLGLTLRLTLAFTPGPGLGLTLRLTLAFTPGPGLDLTLRLALPQGIREPVRQAVGPP